MTHQKPASIGPPQKNWNVYKSTLVLGGVVIAIVCLSVIYRHLLINQKWILKIAINNQLSSLADDALIRLGPDAVSVLLDTMNSPNIGTRVLAIHKISSYRQMVDSDTDILVEKLCVAAESDASPEVRIAALQSMCHPLGIEKQDRRLLQSAFAAINDKSEDVRTQAVNTALVIVFQNGPEKPIYTPEVCAKIDLIKKSMEFLKTRNFENNEQLLLLLIENCSSQ